MESAYRFRMFFEQFQVNRFLLAFVDSGALKRRGKDYKGLENDKLLMLIHTRSFSVCFIASTTFIYFAELKISSKRHFRAFGSLNGLKRRHKLENMGMEEIKLPILANSHLLDDKR